jgi:hypothetical protein
MTPFTVEDPCKLSCMKEISEDSTRLNTSFEEREQFVCHAYDEHRTEIYRHLTGSV